MPLLLDTHVWLWSQLDPEQLGPETYEMLTDMTESLFVATISTLELARLVEGARVELPGTVSHWVASTLELLTAATLELTHDVAREAYTLPGDFHRDPVDRVLAATARQHGLTILTADRRILSYPHVDSRDARS